jgi:hypothetical protein
MSADNGIYILQTPKDAAPGEPIESYGYEYRVRELQCIENLNYDEHAPEPIQPSGEYHSINEYRPEDKEHCDYQEAYRVKYHSGNPDVLISNARNMWEDCIVFTDKSKALLHASELLQKAETDYYIEYGISFIKIARVF